MGTRLYGYWVNCIKDKCPESKDGKCNRAWRELPVAFPLDGKCRYPEYIEYDKELEALGVYETKELKK